MMMISIDINTLPISRLCNCTQLTHQQQQLHNRKTQDKPPQIIRYFKKCRRKFRVNNMYFHLNMAIHFNANSARITPRSCSLLFTLVPLVLSCALLSTFVSQHALIHLMRARLYPFLNSPLNLFFLLSLHFVQSPHSAAKTRTPVEDLEVLSCNYVLCTHTHSAYFPVCNISTFCILHNRAERTCTANKTRTALHCK